MAELHEILAERVTGWRAPGYAHDVHPAIGEILLHARREDGSPRYLREPQVRALERGRDPDPPGGECCVFQWNVIH